MTNISRSLYRLKKSFIQNKSWLIPIALTAAVTLTTLTILFSIKGTERAPKLRNGRGDALYQASNKNYQTTIGTKSGSPKITFSFGDSQLGYVLAGIKETKAKKINNQSVIFPDVLENIDLVYTTTTNGVKEELNIKQYNKKTSNIFLFDLLLNNVVPKKIANDFIDPTFNDGSGKYQFHFEKPFAIDANGNRTDNVILQLGEDKQLPGKYFAKLIVDEQWLHDPTRAYPVTIDPTVVHDSSTSFVTGYFDRSIDTGSGTTPSIETYYQDLPSDIYTVGLWHLDDDPGSGTILDSSGNQNTGTIHGTEIDKGILNFGKKFNGTSDYIDTSSNLNESGDITIEAWFKTTESSNINMIASYGTTNDWLYWMGKDATNFLNCKFYQANSGTAYLQVASTTTVNDGNWHHAACVMAGTTINLYLDGVLVNTSSSFAGTRDISTAGEFYIGKFDWSTTYNFNGSLDEIRVSSTARSAEQIKVSASRRRSSTYTSPVLDLNPILSWSSLAWNELGVTTPQGYPYSLTGLVAMYGLDSSSGTSAGIGQGTCVTCTLTLTNFASTGSRDAIPVSGWTSDNRFIGNGAIMLDGTNDYLTCTDASCGGTSVLDFGTSDFSFAAWIRTSKGTNSEIIRKGSGSGAYYLFRVLSNRLQFAYNDGSTTVQVAGFTTLTDGIWHNVAVSVTRASGVKIYVDGKLDGSATGAATASMNNSDNFCIGASSGAGTCGGELFTGIIDQVTIYDRAINNNEIMSSYNAGNMDIQTRVGSTTNPNDGTWEEWRSTTGETSIDNMDNPLDYATPSANIYTGALVATSAASTLPVIEGTKSLKISTGQITSLTNLVGLWHLDETGGSGAYLKDSTTNANNGTPTGTSLVTGISSKARYFNGTSDYIDAGSSSSLKFTLANNFTISSWIYTVADSTDRVIAGNGWTTAGYHLRMTTGNKLRFIVIHDGANYKYMDSVATITPGWHLVTGTWNGSSVNLYVDGIQTGTQTTSGTVSNITSSLNFFIGNISGQTKYYQGSIDEVKVDNVVRSAEEIAESYRLGNNHYINKTISSVDLYTKSNLPFYVAADRPGTYLSATLGKSLFTNYQADSNTRGLWHMDEASASGTFIKDSSGLSNHLNPNGPTIVEGKIGKGYYFNGASQYISCNDANCGGTSNLDPGSGNWSIGAWVKTSKVPSQMIVAKGTTTGQYAYQLQFVNGGAPRYVLFNTIDTSYIEASASSRFNDGYWHHIVGTYDGTTAKIYVDGQIQASSTTKTGTQTTNSTNNFHVGARTDLSTNYWNGMLDEIFVTASAPTADNIRQMFDYGRHTHPITIDFNSAISHQDPLSGSGDLTFQLMATPSGTANPGDHIYPGDKIIIRENYDGTEYLAQGTVNTVDLVTGNTVVTSWDAGSTFPSIGYTPNATVFKWQREYWKIEGGLPINDLVAITNLTLRVTSGDEGRTVWIDDLKSNTAYLTNPAGSTITSSTGNRYFQYRAVLSSFDEAVSATLSAVTINYTSNVAPSTPTLDSPSDTATNQSLLLPLRTTATDTDSDYLRYKIELCTNVGMTTGCQTFDQTSSQTGWSGQNAQTSTAYTSGTQATYTLQSVLTPATTYYWRSYAIDPAGTNAWSSTQTPRSFTTTTSPSAPTNPYAEGVSNPTNVIDATPEFSAIHSDANSDAANKYQIQVNTASDFSGTTMWDSSETSMSNVANSARSADISYAGSVLAMDGATYYWRIRFTDVNNAVGAWSTTQQFTMNTISSIPALNLPADGATEIVLLAALTTTATDTDSDYLRYKIELCTNVGMTTGCQTFDQTSSQTGWSGQNAQTSTAYTSGTQATYTLQSALTPATTYYWRSYAIDPAGSNTWSGTQASPFSFTSVVNPASPMACRIQEPNDDSSLTIVWNDLEASENGYAVERSVDGAGFASLAPALSIDSTSYQDSTITTGHTYAYRVAPYFTGPIYGDWCVTTTLTKNIGTFKFEGLNFEGIKLR